MKQNKNRPIIKLAPSIFILVFVCLFGNIVSAATIERTYTIPTNDNQVPIGGSKLFWVQVSGIDSNAVITNVEAKFDYIAYGVVQNYVSSRFNRASDPGSSGGQVLVSQGSLPAGNPGTYDYKSFPTNWDGLGVNSNYYFRFSLSSSSPYTCTIKKLYVRITYSIPWLDITYPNGSETLTKGQNYTINWTSSNVSGNALIHLYKGSSYYSTIAASTSNDGSYYPFNPSTSLPDDSDYQICMSAMSGTVSDCSGNFTIQSPPKPDLIIQNQSASPTTVEAGSSTYISCTVKNQGSGLAASSYINYYLSSNTTYDPVDTYFTSDYVSSLSSGGTSSESATVTIPSGTSTGTKYILFYADKDGSVSESNENNNVAYKAITVIDPVNPQVNVSPTTGPQGTTFTETGSGFTKTSTATLYFNRPGLGVTTLPVNTEPDGTYTNPWLCDACPIGTYSYWAIDDTTNKTSNTVYFTVYATNPQVSVSPSSGPQGTTFQQPGTGFTRNSTAILHFTGPDGPSTDNENTDSNGAYSHSWLCDQCPVGTYSYYAVDDTTEQTSNTVYFTVTSDSPVFVPFYRLYKYDEPNNTRDHFYTTNLTERDNAVNTMGYVDEGIECYVSNRSFPGGVPLFRLYKGDANSHFYTTSETEKDIKIIEGYVYEGIQCFVNQDPAEGLTSLHRLKQETGTPYHYFLSAKAHEYETVKTMGYTEENPDGIGYVQLSIAREPTAHGRPQANYGVVDLGSGAFRGLNSTDLILKGRGPSLSFTHYYNSFDYGDYPTYSKYPMGQGWSHGLESCLEEDMDGNVYIKWPNGTISYFEKTGTGLNDYQDRTGNHDTLTMIDSEMNYGYDVKKKNQTVFKYRRFSVNPWPGTPPELWFLQENSRILLIEIKDWAGNTLTFNREAAYGTLLEVRDSLDRKLVFDYFYPSLQVKKVEDSVGGVTKRSVSFTYNTDGTLATFTDARGKITYYSYNDDKLLQSITYPKGNTVTLGYNDSKKASDIQMGNDPASSITYDPVANTTTVQNPRGNLFTYTHNNFRLTSQKGPDMNPASFEYADPQNPNKPTRIVDKESNPTDFEYDSMGNVAKITNARGKVALFTYNTDVGKNNIKSGTEFHTEGTAITPTMYNYDTDGNRLRSITNPENETIWLDYDASHQVTSVKDGRNKYTYFGYDAYGSLERITDAENNITRYVNDYAGRTIQVIDGENKNTWYSHDNTDNLTLVKNHLNHEVAMSYSDNDFLDAVRWLNNGVTSSTNYGYDSEDRLESVTNPLTRVTSFTYNESGNLETRNDYNGVTTTYQYDENSRLKTINYPGDVDDISIGRDKNGSILSATGPEGESKFAYNELNLLMKYTDSYGKIVQYEYNDAGRLKMLTYPGGKTITYGYDKAGRLQSVQDWIAGTNPTTYEYDDAGNLTKIVRPNNTEAVYSHDDASRLTGITEQKIGGAAICSYVYALDGVGNHYSVTATEPLTGSVLPKDVTYTHDKANRLLSAGSITYTYDNNGNRMTSTDAGGTIYTWNHENMLTGIVENSPSRLVQYQYDGMNNRIARIEGSNTTKYVLDLSGDMSRVLAETDENGTIQAYYVYGLGLISSITPDENRHCYHYNNRGDTIALTDASGNVTDSYTYDEYGKLLESTGSTENPFKFVGRYGVMDEGDDLYFMRARFYDAEVGKFLNEDPLGFSGGDWNLYAYVSQNPVTAIDPEGLYFDDFRRKLREKVGLNPEGTSFNKLWGKARNKFRGFIKGTSLGAAKEGSIHLIRRGPQNIGGALKSGAIAAGAEVVTTWIVEGYTGEKAVLPEMQYSSGLSKFINENFNFPAKWLGMLIRAHGPSGKLYEGNR